MQLTTIWVICFQIHIFHLSRKPLLQVPLQMDLIVLGPTAAAKMGTKLQAPCPQDTHSGKMSWDAWLHQGPPWPKATLEAHLGSCILAPGPSPFLAQDGLVQKCIPSICAHIDPWYTDLCRPLIHRQKSKNWQLLGNNWQRFSPLQNATIPHLGLDPSHPAVCIASMGLSSWIKLCICPFSGWDPESHCLYGAKKANTF